MGKSTSSCLKIISCARGDSADNDDIASPESKASSDKRRWSFQKKSGSQRVLSNTVISEPVSTGYYKENLELNTKNFHSTKCSSIQEKAPIQERPKETPSLLPAEVKSEVSVSTLGMDVTNHNCQESVAVVIQASIRGYLARAELLKLRNIVKLQAAIRGHLVRRQAVGTLQCVQAIIKLQALVRARCARMLAKKFDARGNEKPQTNMQVPALWGKASIKRNKERSTEKLLSNGFARQLLEFTPKTKPIHINCDPSKSDSAWKWLERWMAVNATDVGQQPGQIDHDYKGQEAGSKFATYEAVNEDAVAAFPVSFALHLAPSNSAVTTEVQGHLLTQNSSSFEFHSLDSSPDNCFNSLTKHDQDQSLVENEAIDMQQYSMKLERVVEKTDSLSSQIPLQSDATSHSDKLDSDNNNPNLSNKRASYEPLETEGKKSVIVSWKPCKPALAAARSKSEELGSTSSLGRSISSYQDATSDSRLDSFQPEVDSLTNTKNHSLTENSVSRDPRVQVAASECGTEISISSTLDSPDRSGAEGGEIIIELNALGIQSNNVNCSAGTSFNLVNKNAEAKNSALDSEVRPLESVEEFNSDLGNSIAVVDAVLVEQQTTEPTTSDVQTQAGNLADLQASPEGTPRSHATALELHGTPSSQNSVNAKKSKRENNMPTNKQRSQLIGKRSSSNANNDSGGRTSMEHLPKDSKNVQGQNSLEMITPDRVDHEPRTSSSNSLPSYMQATESARAKAHANISPKSSPDVHDKDIHVKKRHSLPIGNGKQGSSPRMQRSTSQAQQVPKGTGTHSPHNSAERRWQR